VAQRTAPESRIVYVDNDPIVLNHAKALLTGTREGACAYIDADLRDAGKIIQDAADTLDFTQPIAVCLIMILQFVPDEDDPWQIVRTLLDAVPPGSYLTIAHPASDVDLGLGPAFRQLNTRMGPTQVVARSHEQVTRFFGGLDLVDPGLVQLHRWRPGPGADTTRPLAAYGGVAGKP
jgi:S-adenosyl methyltransferase